jgi:hypothetical protein
VTAVVFESDRPTGVERILDAGAWRLGYFDPREMSEYVLMRSNQERFLDFQKQYRSRLKNHFYIIVVSNTLDLLEYCLTFLPPNLNLFLILNGLHPWEHDYIEREYPHIPRFTLAIESKRILHDRVLDMLMEANDSNFGVLDQDCFVLDNAIFEDLRVHDNEFAISPFVGVNHAAPITFPRTYFLFFNVPVIKRIRNQHGISFKRCWTIPSNVEADLAALNLGHHNHPHRSLDYFDNFQLIWAMAIRGGLVFTQGRKGRLHGSDDGIVHVGAGHAYLREDFRDRMVESLRNYQDLPQLEKEKLHAAAFCHYAHLILLENLAIDELTQRYLPFFAVYESSRELLETFKTVISPPKVAQMDLVIREARRRRGTKRCQVPAGR